MTGKRPFFMVAFTVLAALVIFGCEVKNDPIVTKGDYERAQSFLSQNVRKLVFNSYVTPNWIKSDTSFWYMVTTRQGKQFYLADVLNKTKNPAFDHERLAKALADSISAGDLPFNYIEFVEDNGKVQFERSDTVYRVDLNTYELEKEAKAKSGNREKGVLSPDGKWRAFAKDHNLFIKSVADGREIQLSRDGIKNHEYGTYTPWYRIVNESEKQAIEPALSLSWSPDSKKIFANKHDTRTARKLYLWQSVPDKGFRAVSHSYERALPGEDSVTLEEPHIFDIATNSTVAIDVEPYSGICNWGNWNWFGESSDKLYYVQRSRGFKSVALVEANAANGKVREVLKEERETYVNPLNFDYRLLEDTKEVIWVSEKDGWNHLYLYDWETGELKNQITKGEFVVKSIYRVDEENRKIYFTAGGREPDRDPYLDHFYHVNFDGSELTLLTPEPAFHDVSLSADGAYFVDNFSRVDLAPKSVLRSSSDGSIIIELEEADIDDLLATGWQYPEPFSVKARDGETDIYGVIYRPSNFDPSKKYPVIDGTYSGPQAVRTPKTFYRGYRNDDQPLAELGFVVVTVDGLGTAQRSKKFHDFSYKNLGDIGSEDHIKAIKELAQKYPYIDVERVGIYGHSAGGYDAARALLKHPDFYKVGVSSAGNHDHRIAKAWWPELYMGYPEGPEYAEQSNMKLAENLEGKLLLVHGDMDNNVNPAETIRLADALIKANKDFDLLILPNQTHNLGGHQYFRRKRWDYFVENLQGAIPPKNFEITFQ
ncbi:DPP IV N-terminal domain-containing protein [Fulvivirgaceae bacterium BMA10]|uniref:DPP IV N-terminal domain-containing protein n=1 Tax=Splendidivirga corallicola TaxID=3051826 RepID=A0ABT8KKH4_9BACT|nr:DPP IV N-terminal domain-containing protein [Fulvivirgaceae bacterium BMA10]